MFLLDFAAAATNPDLDHASAVRRCLANESPGSGAVPLAGGGEAKSPAPDARPQAAKSPGEAKGLGDEAKGSSFAGAFAGGEAAAAFGEDNRQSNDRAQSRAGTRGGQRGHETSDAGLGDAPAKTSPDKMAGEGASELDGRIEGCNSDHDKLRAMMEPVVAKPKCSDKLLAKPPFRFLHDLISAVVRNTGFAESVVPEAMMDSGNVKEKSDKIEYLDIIIKHVGEHLNTLVDARPAKIVAGLEAENTVRFLQLLVLAATNAAPAAEAAQAKSPERAAAPAAASPAKELAPPPAADAKSPAPAPAPAPAKAEPSPQRQAEAKEDAAPAEPKSMRPTTARRRPPKVKEQAAVAVKDVAPAQVAKNTNIMREGEDDDDDFFKDDDAANDDLGEAKRVDAADLQGKNVSKLVQNIVAEQ
ncbi:hypothetical protein TeGR_g10448, partial [Tetraparma gracilis]